MSAGFKISDEVFWGTNGAVEVLVEAMALQSLSQLGSDHPLTIYLQDEREGFAAGRVVFLDECLVYPLNRELLLRVLDTATAQLLNDGLFTEYGKDWVGSVVGELRERIVGECGTS